MREKGFAVEAYASEYLQSQGMKILYNNFQCRMGEIDLIGRYSEYLVFAEVRYRHLDYFGPAAASVTYFKQRKIIRTAQFFLQTRPWASNLPCRFDVIAVTKKDDSFDVDWIQDAFHVV